MSQLLGRTLRAGPAGVERSAGMAARAGLLRLDPDGVILLPLGASILERMEAGLRATLPETSTIMVPPGTENAGFGGVMAAEIQSYRQLPLRIATSRWLATGGKTSSLLEPSSTPALQFAVAEQSAEAATSTIDAWRRGLEEWMAKAGPDARDVQGANGETLLVVVSEAGTTRLLTCGKCGWLALWEMAPFTREQLVGSAPRTRTLAPTPGADTIQALADMLSVERASTLKALFLSTPGGDLVFAVVRGDLEVSLAKLALAIGAPSFAPASEAEIRSAGAVPGFASPIGLKVRTAGQTEGMWVVADPSVATGHDFVAGANRPGFHWVGVDPERDFEVTQWADIAQAPDGARCATCGGTLDGLHGLIVARDRFLDAPNYTDEHGETRAACARLGSVFLLPLMGAVIERASDEKGIAWPTDLSPADVYLIDLKAPLESENALTALEASGYRVLFDDRALSAGAKFNDADLIGCPVRVTVSPRSLESGGAEISGRLGVDRRICALEDLPSEVGGRLRHLMST